MKETGMVRRIDELGRVVIPKEIRRTLRIREGEPLEIYVERDELVLRKYSPLANLERASDGFAESLNNMCGKTAIICDNDCILKVVGSCLKDAEGKRISSALEKAVKERKSLLLNSGDGVEPLEVVFGEKNQLASQVIIPIIFAGDCLGACLLVSDDKAQRISNTEVALVQFTAELLSNRIE